MRPRVAATALLAPGLAGILSAAVLAGCSSSGGKAAPTISAASSGGGRGSGTTVVATETEYKIALSRTSFRPGTYTFEAKDAGASTHALEINGPGVKDRSTPNINHGQSATLTVTLQKGSYEIWCPVDGHKQRGMDAHITVS